jgi:hypothetical protein
VKKFEAGKNPTMESLAKQVVEAVEDAQEKFHHKAAGATCPDKALMKERMVEAAETVLRSSLYLEQLGAALSQVSQHLEQEPPGTRAELRAAIANTVRMLAAFR